MTQPSEMGGEVAEVLERAADHLEQPGAWTQGAYARRRGGFWTYARDPLATSFCMLGAIARAADHGVLDDRDSGAFAALRQATRCKDLSRWNDKPKRKQPEVVAKLREAAALARTTALASQVQNG